MQEKSRADKLLKRVSQGLNLYLNFNTDRIRFVPLLSAPRPQNHNVICRQLVKHEGSVKVTWFKGSAHVSDTADRAK